MCTSLVHIIFNLVLVSALICLISALFTPAWTRYDDAEKLNQTKTITDPEDVVASIQDRGLVIQKCFKSDGNAKDCFNNLWKNLETYEKWTLVLLVGCIAVTIFTIVWSCFLSCACCCRGCLAVSLPVLCLAACLLDFAAIITYTTKTQSLSSEEIWANIKKAITSAGNEFDNGIPKPGQIVSKYGYSVWLAAVGGIGLLGDFAIGIVLCCMAKNSPV